jgi:hypothetical protein
VYDAVVFAARASDREVKLSWIPNAGQSRVQIAVSIVLSLAGLGSGVALGVGTSMFGGRGQHLAARLTGTMTTTPSRGAAVMSVVITVAMAAAGFVLARRVSASPVVPRWLLGLGRPYALLSRLAGVVGEGAWFLHRSVRAMDREVIDDVPAALVGVVARTVRASGRVPVEAQASLESAGVSTHPGTTERTIEPATDMAERIRTGALLLMVALLGLVVLSSILLG